MIDGISTDRKNVKNSAFTFAISFIITAIILVMVYAELGMKPFGNADKSLIHDDAYYQYLDFFAWFKDVLDGKQSFYYSFSNMLGQNNIAFFAYYLASPFNLLLIFFDKVRLPVFLDLIILLKLSTASATAAYYFNQRFNNRLSQPFQIILGISYGLMQYGLTQCSNVFWLDGFYMLPLILLGIYRVIHGDRLAKLSIPVAVTIVFNWYTAGLNCIFSFFWFWLEIFISNKYVKEKISYINAFIRYIAAMLIGISLSAFLFLPSVFALRQGRGGSLESPFQNGFLGNPAGFLWFNTMGADIGDRTFSFFCGGFVLLGCILLFARKKNKEDSVLKIIGALSIIIVMLTVEWVPMRMVFSLFKTIAGHGGRYAYLGTFLIIFLAAYGFSRIDDTNRYVMLVVSGMYLICYVGLCYVRPYDEPLYWKATVAFLIVMVLMMFIKRRQGMIAGLCIVSVIQLYLNCLWTFPQYFSFDTSEWMRYEADEQKLVDSVKKYDDSFYRMTKTLTRSMNFAATANYDEAMAFGYNAVEGYTSCEQETQVRFLDKAGYRNEMGIIVDKNFCILPIDSLLGVKYVLSHVGFDTLNKIEYIDSKNTKSLYENVYALPIAFKTSFTGEEGVSGNPFEFQNLIYTELLGENSDIFVPAEFEVTENDGGKNYTINVPNGCYEVYGNLPWSDAVRMELNLNEKLTIQYADWNSSSVFNVPVKNDNDGKVTVTVKGEGKDHISDEQFYLLDLDKFKSAIEKLRNGAVTEITVVKENISYKVNADEGENLFTSVPYDKGWNILVNGKKIDPLVYKECFMLIPLEKGENYIKMTYKVPGMQAGIIITVISLLVIVMFDKKEEEIGLLHKLLCKEG